MPDNLTNDKVAKLNKLKYLKTLGFSKKASQKDILEKLKELRKKSRILLKLFSIIRKRTQRQANDPITYDKKGPGKIAKKAM